MNSPTVSLEFPDSNDSSFVGLSAKDSRRKRLVRPLVEMLRLRGISYGLILGYIVRIVGEQRVNSLNKNESVAAIVCDSLLAETTAE